MDDQKKEQVLDLLGGIVVELESLFRHPESLTDDEQLFIENRVLFLHSRWVMRRGNDRKHAPTTSRLIH